MNDNTIYLPRKCWFRVDGSLQYIDKVRTWVANPWQAGWLHMFTTGHIEYESGPGPYPAAVVESSTGKVSVVNAENVSFEEEMPCA